MGNTCHQLHPPHAPRHLFTGKHRPLWTRSHPLLPFHQPYPPLRRPCGPSHIIRLSDDRESLEMVSMECSEQERVSAKAEQNVVLLKKLRLLQALHEKDPQYQYEAVVTRVKPFGIFFEVLDFMLESFLHVSELQNDYFVFEEKQVRLRGRHTGQAYHSGDRMTVMLKQVDFITMESQWNLVGGETKSKRPSKKKRDSQKQARKEQRSTRKKTGKSKRK